MYYEDTDTSTPVECYTGGNKDVKMNNKELGIKYDQDKLDWLQMPWCQLAKVAEVTQLGGKKYSELNWVHVEPHRYKKAMMRHITDYLQGNKLDDETGKEHLAHAIANILFLMWHEENRKGD